MTESFLGDVLPPNGALCGWSSRDKQNRWVNNVNELAQLVATDTQYGRPNFYYATAAFDPAATLRGNVGARTGDLVIGKQCYYLDLDAGEKKLAKHGADKVYATQREALAATLAFIKTTKLNPTYIVSSGEGLHLYWCLSETVGASVWKPTAAMLSLLARSCGVKEDPSVTCDIARLLRPVGALHGNGNEVRLLARKGPVYTQEAISAALASLVPEQEPDVLPPPPSPKRVSEINKDVLVEGPPKSLKRIVPKCAAMADAMRARGDVSEPYWRAMLGVIKHTVEGDVAAHRFSSGHPQYNARETQRKLDNWKTGPATCAEFAKHCDRCAACPQAGKVKSPITLGVMPVEDVQALPPEKQPAAEKPPTPTGDPWDNYIPQGFVVIKEGANARLAWNMPVDKETDEGDTVRGYRQVPVVNAVFWCCQFSDAEDTDDTAQVTLRTYAHGVVQSYTLDQTLVANQQKLREFLAGKAIHKDPNKDAAKALEVYMTQQVISMKALQNMPKIGKRLGVFIERGQVKFALGEHVINPDGTIQRGIAGARVRALTGQFHINLPHNENAQWDASVWDSIIMPQAQEYAGFMRKHWGGEHQVKYQLAAMLMIASPIMPFIMGTYTDGWTVPTNQGFTVSLYSQSGGYGKTTLMQAAMGAYGHPTASDKNDVGATLNARMHAIEGSGTLPVAMDEMGGVLPSALAATVQTIANGKGRDRLNNKSQLMPGGRFALVACMGTNRSAMELIAASPRGDVSDAVYHRLLELNVEEDRKPTKEEQASYRDDTPILMRNYGALGAVIAKQMCAMGVERLNDTTHKFAQAAAARLGDDDINARFFERALAAMLMVQAILKRHDLQMFDTAALVAEFKKARGRTKDFVATTVTVNDSPTLVARALHELHGNTVCTMDYTHRRGFGNDAYDEPIGGRVPDTVHARYIHRQGVTIVDANTLREMMRKYGANPGAVFADIKKSGVLTRVYPTADVVARPFNILGGMRVSTGARVPCYAIDARKLTEVTGHDEVFPGIMGAEAEDNVVRIARG